MFYYLITALHFIVCLILILVVLLQSGKGADLAGAFGGGATQTAFGSRGPASFLAKLTTGAAVVFMITSIVLALMVVQPEGAKSVLEETGTQTAVPAPADAPPQPEQKPLTPEEIQRRQKQIEEQQKQNPAPAETP